MPCRHATRLSTGDRGTPGAYPQDVGAVFKDGDPLNNDNMMQPLMISQDAALISQAQSSAAAGNLSLQVATGEAARRAWAQASVVFVGVDQAASLAGLGLPERGDVHIVGANADEVLAWSVPLGAPGLVLPRQAGFLASLLDEAHRPGGALGAVLRLFGATGGLGTSTLAAGLAVRAARRGDKVALVELCPFGGGLDVLMGAEAETGWRWGDLAAARGHVGDLSAQLPTVLGVAIVAASRSGQPGADTGSAPGGEAIAAVLASLRRSHDLIVIDQGRTPPVNPDAVLVVGAEVRAVLAAQAVVGTGLGAAGQVVVRTGAGRRLPADLVGQTVGLPIAGTWPTDARLPGALEAGDPPGRARGKASKALEALLDKLVPGAKR